MLLIIFIYFLFSVSEVNAATAEDDATLFEDEAMAAVVKGSFSEFCTKYGLNFDSINHFLEQKAEMHLGVLHFLRENWECEKVNEKIKKEIEQIKNKNIQQYWNGRDWKTDLTPFLDKVWQEHCEIYRKHVFILYEYLFLEYVGVYLKGIDPNSDKQIPKLEKPNFNLIQEELNFGKISGDFIWNNQLPYTISKETLFDAIKLLSRIWWCFFDSDYDSVRSSQKNGYGFWWTKYYGYKKTQLLNEEELIKNYGINFNKAYLRKYLFKPEQLNLNEKAKFDNSYGPPRSKFEEAMKEHLKTAKKNAKNSAKPSLILYIVEETFYSVNTMIDDNAFLTILTTEINFEKFCNKFAKNLMTNTESKTSNLEETKKYLARKYESFYGIINLMTEKWQCDKIVFEREKCEKFRKYLKILFNYLFLVYDEVECSPVVRKFATVRPIFKFGNQTMIESLIDVVDRLGQIAAYFFDTEYAKGYQNKLEELFKKWPEPKLINAEELKQGKGFGKKFIEIFKGKSPKKGKGKGESSTKSIGSKENSYRLNEKFKNCLNEMSKTAKRTISKNGTDEERLKWTWLFSTIKELKLDDELFLTFIKGHTKFEEICREEAEELWTKIGLLSKRKGKGTSDNGDTVEYLTKQYEGYLGILYLLKEKWQCDGVTEKQKREKCEKFQKYVEILYKYFLKVFVEAKNWRLAQQISASIPNFHLGKETQSAILIDVLDSLIHIWAFFFDSTYQIEFSYKLEELFKSFPNYELKLLNEYEFEQFGKIGQKIVENFKEIKIFGSQKQTKHLTVRKSEKNQISVALLPAGDEKICNNTNDEKAISELGEEFDIMMKENAEKVKKFDSAEGLGKMSKVLVWLVQ